MKRNSTGEYVINSTVGETVKSFVPNPLPPNPPLEIQPSLQDSIDKAHMALGRLDGMASILPDTSLFIYMYIRKEAVLSSQIEGTQSSLSDLLLFEMDAAPGVPMDDVREVSNYVAAMEHGLKRLQEGFPLCNRLICEIHEKLLAKGRGSDKKPGEFRTSQNWIGGTCPGNARFVPPPPERMADCLGAFEKFLNDEPGRTPTLIKAALAHVQFETIHPFLDGNGRLGRLLITLLFCHEKILNEPLLYLSLYFKQNRQAYYDQLQKVREEGDWESWLSFFADAVKDTATQGVSTANKLTDIVREDSIRMKELKRLSGSGLRVLDVLARTPVITVSQASKETGIVESSVSKALKAMVEMGLVKELTGQKRNRIFSYARYLNVLSEGTEPLG
ncbi:MAG TPA: cell filamentation protein Fic [Lentisphaeria bacterium]|nr:MAG: cell filamentation protein Fic [Lentisphaerae bacterium GWF2_49_21]HBC87357.1 cell filamentation protein Fic [Lentisphaeria bacterium]